MVKYPISLTTFYQLSHEKLHVLQVLYQIDIPSVFERKEKYAVLCPSLSRVYINELPNVLTLGTTAAIWGPFADCLPVNSKTSVKINGSDDVKLNYVKD